MALLKECLPSVVRAASMQSDVSVFVVDNGSTDNSVGVAKQFSPSVTVLASTSATVGGVRNDGARAASDADFLVFLDCDCQVKEDFFGNVTATFATTGCAAVGCEVVSPALGHWSERTWDKLHRPGGDGPRHYINSACFAIQRTWFEKIDGFDATRVSSEDVDICRRLTASGGLMWQAESLAVIHLGNPKSVSGLYRRIVWHGEGAWTSRQGVQWSVTMAATFAHVIAVLSSLAIAVGLVFRGSGALAFCAFAAGVTLVPILFVLARAVQHRRLVPVVRGIALMQITFAARLHGILRAIRGRSPVTG
jgi:hypothetical protein